MEYCKWCGNKSLVKNGRTSKGVQRYKCKSCKGTYRIGDKRIKYGLEKRIKVIKMYLEGIGIRSIERLEEVLSTLIIYWIRHFAELIRKKLRNVNIPEKLEDIEILEIDELFTYYKKEKSSLCLACC
ncbi:IS1/IS1595 family N-terminal zinc-binding domain-containing protein [Candidatus Rickettsia kedanie]|uniref:Transposase n=1 Tax=Candidatus Rickettsia kedanie TaxID=3115352 RepID=A0ABP9TVK7_9RICK